MDLSDCYLGSLSDVDAQKLEDLRQRLPAIIERACEESAEARSKNRYEIFGVDIQTKSDATDIVLLKFLRAEELDVEKAQERLVQTLIFRADCRIEELGSAELPEHFKGHDVVGGTDLEGRPVMISRFGKMDLPKVFGDVEAFVRYRSLLMEQAISLLKWEKGAPEDLCQVHDYSGVPLIFQTAEVKGGVQAVGRVFAEHYPELKGKTIFVNFPSVFSGLFKAFSLVIPARTLKKFVILGVDDHLNLFQHLGPEVLPVALGGMVRDDAPHRLTVPCKVVQIRARYTEEEEGVKVLSAAKVFWELRACTAEIAYEVVFIPEGGGAEVAIQTSDPEKHHEASEGVICGEYQAEGAGVLKFRFRNAVAWFRQRVVACRAEVLPEEK